LKKKEGRLEGDLKIKKIMILNDLKKIQKRKEGEDGWKSTGRGGGRRKKTRVKYVSVFLFFFILILLLVQPTIAIIEETSLFEKFILERTILRRSIIEKFFVNYLKGLKTLYANHFLELIEKNPSAFDPINRGITNSLIFILEPLCILALLVIGLYLILLSGTAWGRAFSKSLLPGLLLAILFIPLSTYIMHFLLQISDTLTAEIFSLSPQDPVKVFIEPIEYFMKEFSWLNEVSFLFSVPFVFFASSLLLFTLILFVIRFIFVTFFLMIIPLTIFLYLFIPTREFGRRLLELTLSWTFVQVIAAISLVSISSALLFLPLHILPEELKILLELAATLTFPIITIFTIIVFRNYLPE
jgi:hypothetical protein